MQIAGVCECILRLPTKMAGCSDLALGGLRRELDVTDISLTADVGDVEFTTRTIARGISSIRSVETLS